jgi:hypothetical protein
VGSLRDPVTTDPRSNDQGEIAASIPVTRNKFTTAITRRPQILSPYISGYVDGEGCFMSIRKPPAKTDNRMGDPAKLFSQSKS